MSDTNGWPVVTSLRSDENGRLRAPHADDAVVVASVDSFDAAPSRSIEVLLVPRRFAEAVAGGPSYLVADIERILGDCAAGDMVEAV